MEEFTLNIFRSMFFFSILEMDDAIGQMMKTLKEEGLEDNTLVYFVLHSLACQKKDQRKDLNR